MSTRCEIGIELEDGSVVACYCHYDGYVEGVGERLLRWYDNKEIILELLKDGGFSSLKPSIAEMQDEYYRDGDEQVEYKSVEEFYKTNTAKPGKVGEWWSDREYIYLYRDGQWYFVETNVFSKDDPTEWKLVSSYLDKVEETNNGIQE